MKQKDKCIEYLVAAHEMDDDHHVGHGDQPSRLPQCYEDVVVDGVAECPVANERDGEVTERYDDVGDDDAPPHGFLGRLLGSGRNGGLDLQDHVVASVGEGDVSQCAQEVEDGA